VAANNDLVLLSGPNITLGSSHGQCAMKDFKSMRSYISTDFASIPADYRPRTQYQTGDRDKFVNRYISPLNQYSPDFPMYRSCHRTMLSPNIERTLQAAIIAPNYSHVESATSVYFSNPLSLCVYSGFLVSLPIDFFVRILGRTALRAADMKTLPIPTLDAIADPLKTLIASRVAALNCTTSDYEELWSQLFLNGFLSSVSRLGNYSAEESVDKGWKPVSINKKWTFDLALRTHLERRQALLELDILCGMAMNLSVDELCAIYKVQFPVMQQYEKDTWYDRNGQIVFTSSKGLPGVGFPRKGSGRGATKTTSWEDIQDMTSGTVSRTIVDDTLPGGPIERTITYEAPFDRCDRVEDYKTAWAYFEREGIS
jgi:hypothetical protein